jgi:hypothetical protein
MVRYVVSDEKLRELWEEHQSYKGVARAAGIDRNSVRRRLQRMHLAACEKPAGDGPAPKGFHITQVTTDASGVAKSVQCKKDAEDAVDAPRLAAVLDGHEIKGLSSYVKDGRITGQWVKTRQSPFSSKELVEAIDRHMKDYKGTPLPECLFAPGRNPDERLNHYVWGDPHIGLLSHARETGKNFDLKIATADLRASVDLLVRKAPMAGTAVFCEVGDLWHAQDDRQVTPRGGNKLDVDGRKTKIMEEGLACLRYMVDRLLQLHDRVVVVCVPGNHDPDLSLITRIWLQAVYEGNDRVQVLDNTNPYMYFAWGSNFFMYTHGDKKSAKPRDLGEIMLADRPLEVGAAKHRRAFTGHIHHKQVEEFRTFRWESFNSMCAPDFWHHSEGYRSERLVECITFHEEYGEQSRCRVTRQEIREH